MFLVFLLLWLVAPQHSRMRLPAHPFKLEWRRQVPGLFLIRRSSEVRTINEGIVSVFCTSVISNEQKCVCIVMKGFFLLPESLMRGLIESSLNSCFWSTHQCKDPVVWLCLPLECWFPDVFTLYTFLSFLEEVTVVVYVKKKPIKYTEPEDWVPRLCGLPTDNPLVI